MRHAVSRLCVAAGLMVILCEANGEPSRDKEKKQPKQRGFENRLVPILNLQRLLGDYPEFVEPIRETRRFEAPILVDDEGAALDVRAWRFSYNARGIVEIPNHLRADQTAVI